MDTNILILLDHPNYAESKANRALLEAIQGMDNVNVMDITAIEPTMENYMDVIAGADVIVFQFPMYWFQAPAPLAKWLDSIMLGLMDNPGMAGKKLQVAVTTGAPASFYEGKMDAILTPYKEIASYVGMTYLPYFHVPADNEKNIKEGAKKYRKLLESF